MIIGKDCSELDVGIVKAAKKTFVKSFEG